ncbi:MAG: GNAT family N-acetyltransferase [Chloroflexota bacterium]
MTTTSQPSANDTNKLLIPLLPAHATHAARLHIAGQPGTFLTSLGPDVLTIFYKTLPQSPVGFGYVYPSSNQSNQEGIENTEPIEGFISATTSVGKLFFEMGTRRLPQLLPPLLMAFAKKPSLIPHSLQTVLYPLLVSEPQADLQPESQQSKTQSTHVATAELLSIMVKSTARSQGIGTQLLQQLVADCQVRQITLLDVTVDANNHGARRFYERHAFVFQREFTLYGRKMCLYQLKL